MQEAMMRRAGFRIFSLVGLMFLFFAAPAVADNSSDASQVRTLIERQLDAFAHDDAAGAYALAAPGLKTIFTDPDVFLAMVRARYAPVYRHRSVEFGSMAAEGDDVAQSVTIIDNDNQVWTALYKLARQPDGTWLITGCLLVKSPDSST
jgi:hypothetical protein